MLRLLAVRALALILWLLAVRHLALILRLLAVRHLALMLRLLAVGALGLNTMALGRWIINLQFLEMIDIKILVLKIEIFGLQAVQIMNPEGSGYIKHFFRLVACQGLGTSSSFMVWSL